MRRNGHPSFPSAITCCFFSSLKTLLMPREPIKALLAVNVLGSALAGFQVTLFGRIWVTPEASDCRMSLNSTFRRLSAARSAAFERHLGEGLVRGVQFPVI